MTLRSKIFDDIYFSPDNGLEESRFVFIENNYIPQRFQTAKEITIVENGFGTGLNFLLACSYWRGSKLTYHATEKYPLSQDEIISAISQWKNSLPDFEEYIAKYEIGQQRITLRNGEIELFIHYGEAIESWRSFAFKADIFFFDGFAPAKNPQMWEEEIFANAARIAREGATYSTFTAAGFVKRALLKVGFSVEKIKGYGRKREMMRGGINR